MQPATTNTTLETIRHCQQLGATIAVDGHGGLTVDFGEAEVPSTLLDALRAHKADLCRLYAHTAPGYVEPSLPAPRRPSPPLITPDESPVAQTALPAVAYRWWQPGDVLAGDTASLDTETESLPSINEPGAPPPRLVLATVTDGVTGYYLHPDTVGPFLTAHQAVTFIVHNVGFDGPVLERCLADRGQSLWPIVDANRLACTLQMERLLSLATTGTAAVFASLDSLAQKYCGVPVAKDAVDADGDPIRTSFGKYIGRPHTDIPQVALDYASGDTTATIAVWQAQQTELARVADLAQHAYGFPGADALKAAWAKHGPLTLFVQVKAALLAKVMERQGICFDTSRRDAVMAALAADLTESAGQLRSAGIYVPAHDAEAIPAWERDDLPKSGPAVRTSIAKHMEAREAELLEAGAIEEPFRRTATNRICMDREARADWLETAPDAVMVAFARYEQAMKWRNTYATKMGADRVHPRWNHLLNTGRFSCTGAIALQTIPKCSTVPKERLSLRQCITPGSEWVFVAADFAQIELVCLAAAMQFQTGYGQGLADLIRSGADIHRALAAQMLGKPPEAVSDEERKAVKPVSFGLPGAMGPTTLQRVAKNNYRLELDEDEVARIIEAYFTIAPELRQHLETSVNAGHRVAQAAGMPSPSDGWQMMKVLSGDTNKADGRPMPPEQAAGMWALAQRLKVHLTGTKKNRERLGKAIDEHAPSLELARNIRAGVCRESTVTMTGRVRARCSFAAARNNIFQGLAADGAILGLWRLFRMGFRPAMFVHDEVVLAVRDDGKAHMHADVIARVMKEEMGQVLCGLPVGVEWFVSASFSKRDTLQPGQVVGRPDQAGNTPPGTPSAPGQPASGGLRKAGPMTVSPPKPRGARGAGVVAGATRRPMKPRPPVDLPGTPNPEGGLPLLSHDPETEVDLPW